jgi:hypothetical protein
MRNMSFALTAEQYQNGTKTVTRRLGWKFLKPGEVVMGVRKGMGLKPGEKVEKLGAFVVVSNRREPLLHITQEDVVREGFPDMRPSEFVAMFCNHMGVEEWENVNRIEFKRLEGGGA